VKILGSKDAPRRVLLKSWGSTPILQHAVLQLQPLALGVLGGASSILYLTISRHLTRVKWIEFVLTSLIFTGNIGATCLMQREALRKDRNA